MNRYIEKKFQIPKSKSQIIFKFKFPNAKSLPVWNLIFRYWNLFVFWRLSHTTYFGTNPEQAGNDRQLIQVHYFCHPLYGKQVEIIAHSKRGNDHFYIISFFDNSKVYLPTWMTDPLVCQQVSVEKEPSCSLTALQSLRAYLDCF